MAMNPVKIEQFLGGIDYPASKNDLINIAKNNGADEEILNTLKRINGDIQYKNPVEVTKEIGKNSLKDKLGG